MILEAIFNGEIYPAETVVPKSEKFREAGQAIADIMRYFEQTLSKEDYAKLDVSVFVTRETAALKAVFDFLMFNATPCNFTGLIVNAAAGTMPR